MSKIIKRNQPCIGCDSSDAMQIYENGTAFCFSCRRPFTIDNPKKEYIPKNVKPDKICIDDYRSVALPDRKITKDILEFFDFS